MKTFLALLVWIASLVCASKMEVTTVNETQTATSSVIQSTSYPARLIDGKVVGKFVLGRTTLDEAMKMFPQSSKNYEGNPRIPQGYPVVKVGRNIPVPITVYNPWETNYALFFDKNNRLVILQELGSVIKPVNRDELISGLRIIHTNLKMKETDRQAGWYEMQGELEPCEALLLILEDRDNTVNQSAYAFCCETEKQ